MPCLIQPLISIAGGTYAAGDPDIDEPHRQVTIAGFSTFPGEVTNGMVRTISEYLGPQNKFGIFVMNENHGPILAATSPDEDEDHFKLVDRQLFRREIRAMPWRLWPNYLKLSQRTGAVRILPDEGRYGQNHHAAKDEMAATCLSWWQMKALAMFAGPALGLHRPTDLFSSAEFDVLVAGSKYMTRKGDKLIGSDIHDALRPFNLAQIVPVDDPRFESLANGIRSNTVWTMTRTDMSNKDGGRFPLSPHEFRFVTRGGSYNVNSALHLNSSYRRNFREVRSDTDFGHPDKKSPVVGFRVAIED